MKLLHLALVALVGLASPAAVTRAQHGGTVLTAHPWRDRLAASAQGLASQATDLVRVARRVDRRSPLAREARVFARSTRAFRRAVEAGAPSRVLSADLRVLRRDFRRLGRAAYPAPHVDPRWLQSRLASLSLALDRAARLVGADARDHRRPAWRHRAHPDPYAANVIRRAPRFEIRVGL